MCPATSYEDLFGEDIQSQVNRKNIEDKICSEENYQKKDPSPLDKSGQVIHKQSSAVIIMYY